MPNIDPELYQPNTFSEKLLEHIKNDLDLDLSESDIEELDEIVYGHYDSSNDQDNYVY